MTTEAELIEELEAAEAAEPASAPPQVGALATTVTNLVVTPQTNGVAVACTTSTPVRARLQIGLASGSYTTFTSDYGSAVISTQHLLYGWGLQPNTLYHYIIQWYDQNGVALDATADATFTTLATPAPPTIAGGHSVNGPPAGSAVTVNPVSAAAVAASATTTIGQDATTFASRGFPGIAMVGGRLTVQVAGFYSIFAAMQITADISTGGLSYVQILLGGATVVGVGQVFHLGAGSRGVGIYVGNLAAGTTIDVQVVNGTATATTIATGSSISSGGIA